MAVPKLLLGADPELFVRRIADGKIVSCHDLLPGTKEEPHKVSRGAIQVDGTAAEFNIDPAPHYDAFVSSIRVVMGKLKEQLGPEYELVTEPCHVYDADYFKSLPDKATELGCNPDFNAYTGLENDPPDTSSTPYMRTASGHVHIGWTKDQNPEDPIFRGDCNTVAKELDAYLGVMSLMWDRDPRRRIMYGKAGAIRYKPYGLEYRVLSNKWLTDTGLQIYVDSQVRGCLNNLFSGGQLYQEKYGDAIRAAIDENQVGWWSDKKHPLYNLRNLLSYPDLRYWNEPVKKANHTYSPKTKKPSGVRVHDEIVMHMQAGANLDELVQRAVNPGGIGWPIDAALVAMRAG